MLGDCKFLLYNPPTLAFFCLERILRKVSNRRFKRLEVVRLHQVRVTLGIKVAKELPVFIQNMKVPFVSERFGSERENGGGRFHVDGLVEPLDELDELVYPIFVRKEFSTREVENRHDVIVLVVSNIMNLRDVVPEVRRQRGVCASTLFHAEIPRNRSVVFMGLDAFGVKIQEVRGDQFPLSSENFIPLLVQLVHFLVKLVEILVGFFQDGINGGHAVRS